MVMDELCYLVHLQVGVRGPRLGVQCIMGVMGVSGVVLQTATLLQVSLELLSAPPEEKEKERRSGELNHRQCIHSRAGLTLEFGLL